MLRVLAGQVLSMLMSLTGVFTTLLVNRNSSYPLLQSMCVYFAIAIVTTPIHLREQRLRGAKMATPHSLWKYLLIAVCDVEANFLVVLAYKYTDLTSVQLLDCFTIPCVMVLARLLVRPKPSYQRLQMAGVAVAVLGMITLVVIDVAGASRTRTHSDKRESSKKIALGDVLCLLASVGYALSNVLCEKLLKAAPEDAVGAQTGKGSSSDRIVASKDLPWKRSKFQAVFFDTSCYLAWMTTFAAGIALVQFAALEYSDFVAGLHGWTTADTFSMFGFTSCMVGIYFAMPVLFVYVSAAFANISLLSSDVYALVWNVVVFKVAPMPLYFLPFAMTIGGAAVFDMYTKPQEGPNSTTSSGEGDHQGKDVPSTEVGTYGTTSTA